MKIIKKVFLLVVFTFLNCNAQEEIKSSLEVIYDAKTRGSFVLLKYTNNTLIYESSFKTNTVAINNKQKEELEEIIQKINLSEINNLTSPSTKRFSDGALSAHFIIKQGIKKYKSSDFDHENPPSELLDLYHKLINIIKKG